MSPGSIPQAVLNVVEQARQREEAELARAENSELVRLYAQTATGTGDIDETFQLNRHFRLVFVRCHCVGGAGTSSMTVSVDSAQGSQYDTVLFTVANVGLGVDANYHVPGMQLLRPSSWTLQPGDAVRVTWTNPAPGQMTWGLEVGLAPA